MLSIWTNEDAAGLLPLIFAHSDKRPAHEQLGERYAHGGGFNSFEGFTAHCLNEQGKAFLRYPGDPPMREVSRCVLSPSETLVLFEASWLAIVKPDGSYAVCRVD